jgi:hypothetical protein
VDIDQQPNGEWFVSLRTVHGSIQLPVSPEDATRAIVVLGLRPGEVSVQLAIEAL